LGGRLQWSAEVAGELGILVVRSDPTEFDQAVELLNPVLHRRTCTWGVSFILSKIAMERKISSYEAKNIE